MKSYITKMLPDAPEESIGAMINAVVHKRNQYDFIHIFVSCDHPVG